jgi:TonB-dependent starch-binding outer membrane protein SusC
MNVNLLCQGKIGAILFSPPRLRILKLVVLLLTVFCLQVHARVFSQQITLSERNAPLEKVFRAIRKQSGYLFLYSNEVVRRARPVTIEVKNATIEKALELCFQGQPLTYSFIDRTIVIKPKPEPSSRVSVPALDIRGKVQDEKGDPLPGVSINLKGSSVGSISDVQGNYAITVPEANGTLVFSFIGYSNQEVPINGRTSINVTLAPTSRSLNEVVVVGYGTQKKSLVTGAISSVKAEELATVSSTRVEQALQGRTAGVYVLPASGSPGSGMRVRIRGAGSNGNAEPLYIVDGMRAQSIEYLDPSEIASMEVLKDAASAAIYGAEGANGVVIISTKTGKTNGATNISYSGQYGVQSIGKRMPMMDARQYATYMQEANAPGSPTPAEVAAVPGAGTNWFEEILETAPMQRHSLNFSGGTEKSSFLVGGSAFQQAGIVGGDKAKFNRYTLRLNSDHQIKPWLHLGNRISYSNLNRTGIQEDSEFSGVLFKAIILDPLTPVSYSGALPDHVQSALDDGKAPVRDAQGNFYGVSKYVASEAANPLSQIAITQNRTLQNKIVGNLFADVEPLPGLKLTTRYGIDAAFQRVHRWDPAYWLSPTTYNDLSDVVDTNEDWFSWQWENFATYQKEINQHSFSLLAGVSALSRSYNLLNGSSSGMFRETDNFSYHSFIPDNFDRIAGYAVNNTLSSYYGRLSYDYGGKYLFNATLRRDGTSLLPPSSQWGTFPSVSAGWVVSNEAFFPANPVSHLKLRASWGQNGNLSNLQIGQWASTITSQNLRYQDSNGNYLIAAEPAVLPNYDLKWETSEQFDAGVDIGLLANTLTFTADYFNKTTKDLLTPGTPPSFVGFPLPIVNGGNVRNRGFEFEVSYRQSKKAFQYEVAANGTFIDNEATYLNPKYPRIGGAAVGTGWTATAFEVGYPLWYFRGYKTNGIFQTQGQIDDYLRDNTIAGYAPKPGDPVVVDVNQDGIISPDDQTYIGSPHPDFMFGSRINLSFRGFDLLVFAQGQLGNEILMGFNRLDIPTANKPALFFEDRWTGPGSTNTGFAANTTNAYIYNSDKMIFNGAYLRIRQLQLGYTLPGKLADRVQAKSLRLYLSLDNYFTFTHYPGSDPEAGSNNQNSLGIDRGVYPLPRNLLGGLTFSF